MNFENAIINNVKPGDNGIYVEWRFFHSCRGMARTFRDHESMREFAEMVLGQTFTTHEAYGTFDLTNLIGVRFNYKEN